MVRRHPGLQRALRGASRGPAGPSWLGWFVALGIWSIWVRRGLVWPVPSGTAPAVLQAREGASCLQSVGGDVGLGAPGESRGGCLCCPQEPGERPGQVRGGRAHSGNAVCAALPPPDTTWLESPPVGPLTRIRGARPVDLLSVFSAGRAGGGTREGAPRTLQHWAPSCRWKGSQGGTGRGDAQAPGAAAAEPAWLPHRVPLAVSLTPPPLPPAEPGRAGRGLGPGPLLLLPLEALVSEVPPTGSVRFP